jgi:hypothetical protein
MNPSLPTVLIYGVDNFVAQKLTLEILGKDMNVIGVGNWVSGFGDLKNFAYVNDVSEINENFAYVFDFVGSELVWKKAEEIGAKITVICSNDKERSDLIEERLKTCGANWRMIVARGVYGAGMRRRGFLAEAMVMAVKNKNLVLPPVEEKFRILSAGDLVEAIMRATFLAGTEKEIFWLEGKETETKDVAETLIDRAKMTRFKVMEGEKTEKIKSDEEIEENWRKLRWEPVISFYDGVEEALQYFFSKSDEESRKGIDREDAEVKTGWQKMEVVVEEPAEEVKKLKRKKKIKEFEPEITEAKVAVEEREEEIEEEIEEEEILVEESEDEEVIEEKPIVIKEVVVKKEKRRWPRWIWVGLGVIFFSFLMVPTVWAVNSFRLYKRVEVVKEKISKKEYEDARDLADNSIKKIRAMEGKISKWELNKYDFWRDYQTLLRVGEEVFLVEKESVGVAEKGEKLGKAILESGEFDWNEEYLALRESMTNLSVSIGRVQARLKGDWGFLPVRWKSMPQKVGKELDGVREKLDLLSEMMEVLPEMVGASGVRKDYLVLLQNETELRPGGGFIGSLGFLSFESGHLMGFEVKDVYEADGQLKGHVEPPEEIKNYLGEAGWYLRDANWDADFTVASEKIKWFLQKELGREVDGVIGINLAVAKGILGAMGEVEVPDFGETVNKDNLYEQAEFWAEAKFFPGSSQKASFLGGLSRQMFEEIKILSTEKQLALVMEMVDLLQKNEIQISIDEAKVADKMASFGWDGAMWTGECGKDNCLADYLYIVEANVGVNKANYFLYRNIEQLVEISQRSVARVLKINYENTALNDSWPGGDYKNYMRVYLPLGANLAQVVLKDGNNPAVKKVYTDNEMKIKQVGNKKELGFLMTVPVGEKRILEIRYSSVINLTGGERFSYLGYIQKQSGFGDTGMVTLVSMPEGYQALQVEPAASVVGDKLLFNQKLDRDIKMGVEIGK